MDSFMFDVPLNQFKQILNEFHNIAKVQIQIHFRQSRFNIYSGKSKMWENPEAICASVVLIL